MAAAERPWRQVLSVFIEAGRGLFAAHAVGIVHRDFKPENVLIGDDLRVRVTDFGLARSLEEPPLTIASAPDARTTPHTKLAGTPAYMAPEQILGAELTARTDQFSFCVALYAALYGLHPFLGKPHRGVEAREIFQATLLGVVHAPPPNALPAVLLDALTRGMAREPSQRFPTLAELLEQLTTLQASAKPLRPWWQPAAAGALLVGASVVAFFLRGAYSTSESPRVSRVPAVSVATSPTPAASTLHSPDSSSAPISSAAPVASAAPVVIPSAAAKASQRVPVTRVLPAATTSKPSGAATASDRDRLLNPFRRKSPP
jgi:serine/threonine protein kinase